MRCKKHLPDLSSTIGVCATCLRERLIAILAAQAQAQAQAHAQVQLTRNASRTSDERSRNNDANPPPLVFPRSVSPYVSRRQSDYAAAWNSSDDARDRLFYSTPQLGPTYGGNSEFEGGPRPSKKRLSKFWKFSNLFRTRSEKYRMDPSCEKPSPSASPSWFSTFFPSRRKNQDRTGTAENSAHAAGTRRRYHHRVTDRGMSPVRTDDFGDECDRSPSGSGYASESSPQWRRTPLSTATPARRSRLGHAKSISGSGMAICLSPLVRASPNRRWNHKGLPPEMAAAVEVRAAAAKPHLSAAASFCANRSRKLADFGRVNHNR